MIRPAPEDGSAAPSLPAASRGIAQGLGQRRNPRSATGWMAHWEHEAPAPPAAATLSIPEADQPGADLATARAAGSSADPASSLPRGSGYSTAPATTSWISAGASSALPPQQGTGADALWAEPERDRLGTGTGTPWDPNGTTEGTSGGQEAEPLLHGRAGAALGIELGDAAPSWHASWQSGVAPASRLRWVPPWLAAWGTAVLRTCASPLQGVDMSADVVAIAMVYFVQGVLGLARLAISFFLKDQLGLDPDETAVLSGLSTLPWLVKPLYGFLSDGVPLCGYHRRSYLVLCGFVGAAAWAILAAFVRDKYSTVAMILLSSLSVAMSDVVVDSMVVERSRGESQATAGSLQSLCWGSSAFGGIVSAYSSGSLVESYGTRFVFGVTAVLPLITCIAGFFIRDRKVGQRQKQAMTLLPVASPAFRGAHDSAPSAELVSHRLHFSSSKSAPPALFIPSMVDNLHHNTSAVGAPLATGQLAPNGASSASSGATLHGAVRRASSFHSLLEKAEQQPTGLVAAPHDRTIGVQPTAWSTVPQGASADDPESGEQDGLLSAAKHHSGALPHVGPTETAVDDSGARLVGHSGQGQSVASQLHYLWLALTEPGILLPTLFIFLWQAAPKSETAMFFYTTNQLGFGPEFLGRVRLVTAVASLLGVGLYNQMLKEVPLRVLFFWCNILGMALGATQLVLVTGANRAMGISDHFFALGDSLLLTVLGQISFMPVLVLAARLCPPGIEATLYATLMSVSNGANVVGGMLGAALTRALGVTSSNFSNLALLVLICNFSPALCLPFLRLLPKEDDIASTVEHMQNRINASKEA